MASDNTKRGHDLLVSIVGVGSAHHLDTDKLVAALDAAEQRGREGVRELGRKLLDREERYEADAIERRDHRDIQLHRHGMKVLGELLGEG